MRKQLELQLLIVLAWVAKLKNMAKRTSTFNILASQLFCKPTEMTRVHVEQLASCFVDMDRILAQ